MRRDEQRGRVGRWLRTQRLERGYTTQVAAIKALGSWGWPVAASVYAEWESGSRVPSDENLARLQEFFGGPVIDAAPAADQSAIVAAIDRQTEALIRQAAAIEALVARLGDLALGQVALAEEVARVVDPQVALRRFEEAQNETPRGRTRHATPRPKARPWEADSEMEASRG